jgi:hypothetical protein
MFERPVVGCFAYMGRRTSVRRALPFILISVLLSVEGCGRLFGDTLPEQLIPAEAKKVAFELVAQDNRCEPSVLAADREGRALVITLQVTSVGKDHVFLIPDLNIRQTVAAQTTVNIPVVVARSAIFEYACTNLPWIGPFAATGKMAIK